MSSVIELSRYRPKTPRRPPLHSDFVAPVVSIAENTTWHLRQLRRKILTSPGLQAHCLMRGSYVREFRQEFFRIARKRSGLSIEELCELLNGDRSIRWRLQDLLPKHWKDFYPFTPEFVSNLESNIRAIPEYTVGGGGFMIGPPPGVPTCEIAATCARFCGMWREHAQFESWCSEFHWSEAREQGL